MWRLIGGAGRDVPRRLRANRCDRGAAAKAGGGGTGEIDTSGPVTLAFESNMTRERFEQAVTLGKEYIKAGDIFQFVPSQRLRVRSKAEPFNVYRALRVINPSPFMFFLKSPQCTLIGASPEILCRVMDGEVTSRPLAGTRRRGANEAEDQALEKELLADPKERAEHIMLVDLHRNDVGRVAVIGSVKISDVMTVERYSHVMHITSHVSGTLAPGKTALDALAVSLPVGTVSGAPKIRAMQIIDELEPTRRGPYGGAVGYLDFAGNMDTCIALRTMVWQDEFTMYKWGRVVADSVPALEWEETMAKAKALLKAVRSRRGVLSERARAARGELDFTSWRCVRVGLLILFLLIRVVLLGLGADVLLDLDDGLDEVERGLLPVLVRGEDAQVRQHLSRSSSLSLASV